MKLSQFIDKCCLVILCTMWNLITMLIKVYNHVFYCLQSHKWFVHKIETRSVHFQEVRTCWMATHQSFSPNSFLPHPVVLAYRDHVQPMPVTPTALLWIPTLSPSPFPTSPSLPGTTPIPANQMLRMNLNQPVRMQQIQ